MTGAGNLKAKYVIHTSIKEYKSHDPSSYQVSLMQIYVHTDIYMHDHMITVTCVKYCTYSKPVQSVM